MDKKLKIKLILSGIVATSTIAFIIIQRNANKKLMAKIQSNIDKGINEAGLADDIVNDNAFDPNYWKTFQGKVIQFNANPKATAITLKKAIGELYTTSDEDTIFKIFNNLNSKASISMVADEYQKLYKTPLVKDLIKIDVSYSLKDVFGYGLKWESTETDLMKIQKMVLSKPDYIK